MKQQKVIVKTYLLGLTEEDVANRKKLEAIHDGDFADILRELMRRALQVAPRKAERRAASPEDEAIADELLRAICETNPSVAQKTRVEEVRRERLRAWAEDIEKLRRIDNATTEQIRFVINWLYRANSRDAQFWRANVLSAAKLREKFDQLVGAIKRESVSNAIVSI